MVSAETVSAVPAAAKGKETWSYLADGRWAQRVIYPDDVDRQECVKPMRWTAAEWAARRESDPSKLRLAARLGQETVLSVRSSAARVHLGSDHTADANLHAWMKQGEKGKVR